MKKSSRIICAAIALISLIAGVMLWDANSNLFIVAGMSFLLFGSAAATKDNEPLFKD